MSNSLTLPDEKQGTTAENDARVVFQNGDFGVVPQLCQEVFSVQLQLRDTFRDSLRVGARLGGLLEQAKGQCRHGEFVKWLKAHFEGSARQAQRFMLLAREYPDPQQVPALSLREALRLLAGSQAKPKTVLATERISADTASVVLSGIGDVMAFLNSRILTPLEAEGLTDKHPALKSAKKLAADVRKLRELIQNLSICENAAAQPAALVGAIDDSVLDTSNDSRNDSSESLVIGGKSYEIRQVDGKWEYRGSPGGCWVYSERMAQEIQAAQQVSAQPGPCPRGGNHEPDDDGDCRKCFEPGVVKAALAGVIDDQEGQP